MGNLNRREFIAGLAAMLGTAAMTPGLANAVNIGLTFKPSGSNIIFSEQQMMLVARIADIIIPATDTPGAIDAGVHLYIDHIAANWMNKQESNRLLAGIDKIDADAKAKYDSGFLALDNKIQIAIVQALDDNLAQEPAYKMLKTYTVTGYYTSKIGMTVELNYDPIPGPYKEIPLSDVGKAWS
ncbi:gluconate 2-dehydrogenase subunit 3 family protein [Thalassotalea fonticola]|uniref:Gluconate 2-dehydrogenase subunit 3 family protein n=1 Tax=Thalassotalea fonticola TaxID=3065649 RepID=A0ABZ0GW53_9GAMM|nr:gluconate 2-dehydrogenase subunit 3 family protein [Colwelliaceae bacterium S1-1]